MEHILDDKPRVQSLDPTGMGKSIAEMPEYVVEGAKIGKEADLSALEGRHFSGVVVSGMGGSAIGGELLGALVSDELPIPYMVNRQYSIPAWVGKGTLFIASSYSGNTEETLYATEEAVKRGATIVVISSGGRLGELAEQNGWTYLEIPGGLQPRAALGYSFMPLLTLLSRLGLVSDRQSEIDEAAELLRQMREELGQDNPTGENMAKKLAEDLHSRLPIIFGTAAWSGVVAYRWKCQINENSKHLAFHGVLPELNHNEVVGWEAVPEIRERMCLIFLTDIEDDERTKKRISVTEELAQEAFVDVREVKSRGNSRLARMMSLVYVGDWTSYYLALATGIDPTPVKRIDYLKKKLAEAD